MPWSPIDETEDDVRAMTGRSPIRLLLPAVIVLAAGCSDSTTTRAATSSTRSAAPASSATTASTGSAATGLRSAKWASNVTVTFDGDHLRYRSDGLPNHARQAEYALPNGGVVVPRASTAHAGADPTVAQSYDFTISTNPVTATAPTSTSLGPIGVMISGAVLFNPYEGDSSTVATASNFSVKDAAGNEVAFLDSCNGHPTPMGQYHYHALPKCVTATVDQPGGPSHIIGVAFDGFPIYGDRDVDGKQVKAAQLDACSGITSATPEFPNGIYHYVLLDAADSTSSIRCFTGTVDPSLGQMGGMPMGHP